MLARLWFDHYMQLLNFSTLPRSLDRLQNIQDQGIKELMTMSKKLWKAIPVALFVTVAVVISLRRRLGRDERSRLDEAEGTGPARADLPASPADSVGTARRKSGR